tara:strand:+ start:2118 stop:2813 length:696 start_codon:yes stop_codon:yes gene_type:complete
MKKNNKILEKIKSEKIQMRSKQFFALKAVPLISGLIIVFLAGIFILSFAFFIINTKNLLFLTKFGWLGAKGLVIAMPWLLLIIFAIFIILSQAFAKNFSIVYKKPLIYSFAFILILSLCFGLFISKTPLHNKLSKQAMFRKVYQKYQMQNHEGLYVGVVLDPFEQGFNIKTKNGEIFKINTTKKTRFPKKQDVQSININDFVVIIGEKINSEINAFGVRKINKQDWARKMK